uniref:Putative methyltransferase n=1 Tax=viral metagenome TaxID=1070528 RepID=A0A6M3M2Q0_9ZZZZ
MKVLNLYAGIGGNRKLWEDVEVTAVEWIPEIAQIYRDFFPEDEVIETDAHQFLLENFQDYDFIWSSPPCPTHSRIRKQTLVNRGWVDPVYPNMDLYEEVLFLDGYCEKKWCVENVISWYNPLIKPQVLGRHYFWANFMIREKEIEAAKIAEGKIEDLQKRKGFDLSPYKEINKKLILRNCVEPELGKIILDSARGNTQMGLFDSWC